MKDESFSIADDHTPNWAYIRLAGEKASTGDSFKDRKIKAATYLHYLLLARPDFLVAQGLLTTDSGIVFLLGIGGVGIREHTVEWKDKIELYKLLYAFIYRLYRPSHFADPAYRATGFDKDNQVIYTMHIKGMEYPGFRPIHGRTPFDTRTHVLSNPSSEVMPGGEGNGGPLTVVKDQLCRTGRRFNEEAILSMVHQSTRVPGVVEAVVGEVIVIDKDLCSDREKRLLGLRQMGRPFTKIPTAKKVLEMLFDVLEVLRFLRFDRKILHRDISVGNILYIENPETPEGDTEELSFAAFLLKESKVPQETSLLLVDFNLAEDLTDKNDKHIERTGTPIFISRAVQRGKPVPLSSDYTRLLESPTSPECYTEVHPDRASVQAEILIVDPNQVDPSPNYRWRHELDHDVESVYWLLLYWAMVAQPKGYQREGIDSTAWSGLLGNVDARELLVNNLSSFSLSHLTNLTHSVYAPLRPLIKNLAEILKVDKRWVPETNVRRRPEYICEAFQRLILQFIISNRDERFMTCPVDKFLRSVQPVALSGALTSTLSEERDGSDRAKRRRLDRTEDEDDNE